MSNFYNGTAVVIYSRQASILAACCAIIFCVVGVIGKKTTCLSLMYKCSAYVFSYTRYELLSYLSKFIKLLFSRSLSQMFKILRNFISYILL